MFLASNVAAALLAFAAGSSQGAEQTAAANCEGVRIDLGQNRVELPTAFEVPLVLVQPLSSNRNVRGDRVELEVAEDLRCGSRTLLPKGVPVLGELSRVETTGAFGRSGRLEIRLLYANVAGNPVRLSGRLATRGKGGTPQTVVAAAVGGILAFAVTGKSAVLPIGTRLSGYLDGPTVLALVD